jgi:AcrR family transcriptional regulator
MPHSPDPLATSVWLRPARSRTGQPTLSRDQIVRAALELLDAEGTEGLSMRRLAAKLGSGATSLYWYVANKDELLDLVLDEVMGEVPLSAPAGGDWRDEARAVVHGLRDTILRHPWLSTVLGMRPAIGPKAGELSERVIALLTRAGFEGLELAYANSVLMSHAVGAASMQAAWHVTVRRSGASDAEMQRSLETHVDALAADRPNYAKWWNSVRLPEVDEMQQNAYDFGVERMLDGLTVWLERRPAGRGTV